MHKIKAPACLASVPQVSLYSSPTAGRLLGSTVQARKRFSEAPDNFLAHPTVRV